VKAAWLASLALVAGCKRTKLPVATHVWLGPTGGCVQTLAHPKVGTAACWGANTAGEVGDGTRDPRPYAVGVTFPSEPTSIALAPGRSAGIFRGTLWEWGGRSATPTAREPASHVVLSSTRTCLRDGDALRCDPPLPTEDRPVRAVALGPEPCVAYAGASPNVVCGAAEKMAGPVTALVAGRDHTCALLPDRTLRCWGRNEEGQLGDGTKRDADRPSAVLEINEAVAIGAGDRHTCALLANRTVACWGANEHHQLANGTTAASSRPGVVVGLVGVRELAVAGDGACALIDEGVVRCWGRNDHAQLGDGTTQEHNVPMPMRYGAAR